MLKIYGLLLLIISLLVAVLSPAPLIAQGQITIGTNSAVVQFPTGIAFSLGAESEQEITEIRLHYITSRQSFAQVTSEVDIIFEPSKSVEVSYLLDMAGIGGLPPGTILEYWWTLVDSDDSQLKTDSTQIDYDDNRYGWKSLAEGDVRMHWYTGEDEFASELMVATQAALSRLAMDTGARLSQPVDLYIYANTRDLQSSMVFSQEWTGGVAFTRYNTISIGIAPHNLDWGKRAITHELAHIVTHQMTFNPYSDLPTWLNEGLSMYAEGELQPFYQSYLNAAIRQDSLFSVRSLSSPFSTFTNQSYQSYAQSYSLVNYLISEYGQSKMFELLSTFKNGSSDDGAFLSVYNFDMDSLNELWRGYVNARSHEVPMNAALAGLIVLVGGGFLVAVFWLWWRRPSG